MERLGGRCIADVSPSGGRHVFVLFAAASPWRELRDVARAMALRYPAVDPAPMASLGGQISPPGARHKSGGWRLPSMPLEDARAAVEDPCGPEVWAALLAELAAELRQVEPVMPCGDVPEAAELDDAGVPWVPRLGGRAALGAELEQIARSGRWDRSRYAGRGLHVVPAPQIDQRAVLVIEEEHPLAIRLGRRARVPAVRRHLIIRQEFNRHGPQGKTEPPPAHPQHSNRYKSTRP